MTALIALLISLLGYGTPSDFDHLTEDELNVEIAAAEAALQDDGHGSTGGWDTPGADNTPQNP